MMRMFSIFVLVLFSSQAFADTNADSKAPTLVVCYAAGSVNRRQARRATQSMLEVMERLAKIDKGTYQSRFTSRTKECVELLNDKTTHFISPALGFFLKYQKSHHLVPVALPSIKGKSTDRWYVMVRKGSYKKIADLKGKVIGGPLVEDTEFLGRVVFQNKIDPGKFFVLKRSSRVLRALRKLVKGKLDAVIVNRQQYNALPSLPFGKDLEPVFTSGPMPVPSILAVGAHTNKKELRLFAKALSGFCADSKGKSFCDLFGIDAFVPAGDSVYDRVEKLWEDGAKKGIGGH